jgi:hypothetical protein
MIQWFLAQPELEQVTSIRNEDHGNTQKYKSGTETSKAVIIFY